MNTFKYNSGTKARYGAMILLPVLAACSSGTSNSISQAPTSSGGYAGDAGNADPTAITISASAPLGRRVGGDRDNATYSTEELAVTVSNQVYTNNVLTSFDVTVFGNTNFNGKTITLTWDNNIYYEGTADGVTYRGQPLGRIDDGTLSMLWINVEGNGFYTDENDNDHWGSYRGIMPIGINTAPDDVAARTDTATYTGYGNINLTRADDGIFWGADSNATLNADFTAGTISGQLTNLRNFSNNPEGYNIADGAVVTIKQAKIDGNAFTVNVGIDPADFGLSANDDITGLGQFYGEDAANVGGSFSGTGTDSDDGVKVYIQGGFGAKQPSQ